MNTWHVDQLPSDQLDPQLAAMSSDGVTLAREDAPWDWVEPNAPTGPGHSYHWGSTGQWMAEAAKNHIAWLPMLGYSPPWAAADPDPVWHSGSPPADIAQYASFARALASRYGPGGSFWTRTRRCLTTRCTSMRSGTRRTATGTGTPGRIRVCTPGRSHAPHDRPMRAGLAGRLPATAATAAAKQGAPTGAT
jgi:hypothetical protein